MGLFRTVLTSIPCARCGIAREEVEVQFSTDDEYSLPVYREGDVDPELDPGQYDGSYEALCAMCTETFVRERTVVWMTCLADRVSTGELVVRDPTGAPIGPDAVRALGRTSAADQWEAYEFLLSRASMSVWEGSIRRTPYEPLEDSQTFAFWRRHEATVDAMMRSRGWRHGQSFLAHITVHVDADQRVWLGADADAPRA